jgi:hypothetical protein
MQKNQQQSQKMETIQLGIDMISNGLLILCQHKGILEELGGKNAVDLAARLNAIGNDLYSVLDPMKAKVKSEALLSSDKDEIKVPGNRYMAVVTRGSREVIDGEALTAIFAKLKKLIPKKKQPLVQVSFEVKP